MFDHSYKMGCFAQALPFPLVIPVLMLGAVFAAAVPAEGAEDDQANVPVRQRAHPEFDAVGIRYGSAFFYPSVTAGAIYDTNIFASSIAPVDDMGLLLAPGLLIRKEHGDASDELEVGAKHIEYQRFHSEDRTEAHARFVSKRQFGDDVQVDTDFEAARLSEQRGDSLTATNSVSPITYNDLRAEAKLTKTFDGFGVTIGGDVRNLSYEDGKTGTGAVLDQSYRDGTIITADLQPFYYFSPEYRIYARLRANQRDYQGTGSLDRDSRGFDLRTGFDFRLTSMLSGSIEAGYLDQYYSNPLIPEATGLSGLGNLRWLMTPLMTVSLFASRSVAEVAAQGQEARLDLTAGGQIDYELRRDLIATVEASFTHEDFPGAPRQDEVLNVKTQIDYLMNPYIHLGLQYMYFERQSNVADVSFDKHTVVVNVTAKY